MRDFRVVLGLGAALLAGCGSSSPQYCARGECVVAIDAHVGTTSCALLDDASIRCWGRTFDKGGAVQLYTRAVAVPGPVRAAAVSVGYSHLCALLEDQTVGCWGSNGFGQLGNGGFTDAFTPVKVSSLTGVAALSSGLRHSCAVLSGGTVECWGGNEFGQLGSVDVPTGSPASQATSSPVPVAVTGVTQASRVVAGNRHSCAIVSGGAVKCWGENSQLQLGNPAVTTALSAEPVDVAGLSGATDVAIGNFHGCAVIGGGVKCWGFNQNGELGNGTLEPGPVATPADVPGLSGVTALAAGGYHTCALLGTGKVKCWGSNVFGQLGGGALVTGVPSPVEVASLSGVTAIAAGFRHTCALLPGVGVRCWGEAADGALGYDGVSSVIPIEVRF